MSANAILFRLLLGLVCLAPLPLASNRPWSWSLLSLLTGCLLIGWAVCVLRKHSATPVQYAKLGPVMVPFGLALLWAVLQTVSFVPTTWVHPLWLESALGTASMSLNPHLTATAIMRLCAYGGIFFLACQLCRDRSRARLGLMTIAIIGVVYGIYGLISYFSGSQTILWLDKWSYFNDLTSTFVNRNAYAAYAGLGLLCCIALFVNALPRPGRRYPGNRDVAEALLLHSLPFLVGAALLITAIVLTHSRAMLILMFPSIAILMACLAVSRVVSVKTTLYLLLLLLIGGGLIVFDSGDGTFIRILNSGIADDDRSNIYRLTWNAVRDNAWMGTGLGVFEQAFRLLRDSSIRSPLIIDYAHNIHLETMLDLGLPAAAALYGAVIMIVGTCLRGLVRRRRDQIYPAVAITATVLLAAHGMVDFSLQMPAIAATLAFLLGLGFAQSWNTAKHGQSGAEDNPAE